MTAKGWKFRSSRAAAAGATTDFGDVRLTGAQLEYRSRAYGAWDLVLEDLAVVGVLISGEFLLPAEQEFYVLVRRDGSWVELPRQAENCTFALCDLERRLGCTLRYPFEGSPPHSCILWPRHLDRQPLFMFRRLRTSVWDWTLGWFFPRVQKDLSAALRAELVRGTTP